MKFAKFAFIVCAVVIFANGCNNSTSSDQPPGVNSQPSPASQPMATTPAATPPAAVDEFASIRATYSAACAKCHRPDGEGGIVELDDGKTLRVPSYKKGHALKETDQEFAKQIANGGDGMPAFKSRLDQEQIDGLIRFIRKEFQSEAAMKNTPSTSPPERR